MKAKEGVSGAKLTLTQNTQITPNKETVSDVGNS